MQLISESPVGRCRWRKTNRKHSAKQNATFPLALLKTKETFPYSGAVGLLTLRTHSHTTSCQKKKKKKVILSALQGCVVSLPCVHSQDRSHFLRQCSSLKENFCIIRHLVQQPLTEDHNSSKTDQMSGEGWNWFQERSLTVKSFSL